MSKGNKYSPISTKKTSSLFLLPIILIIAVIPLIVRMHVYEANLAQYNWYSSLDTVYDFFLYYKSLLFILISISLLIILTHRYVTNKKSLKFTPELIPLVIYAILAILSSVFSEYSYFSYHGMSEQFESLFVLLGYSLVVYYTFTFVNSENDIKKIIKWWMISIFILCFIGLTQLLGHDIFYTIIGKKLITPASQWNVIDNITFSMTPRTVYSTLYNPNYVGFYASLAVSVFFVLTLFAKSKKQIGLYVGIILILVLCMFGSGSRNGLISLGVSILFVIILFRKTLIKHWKLPIVGISAIAFAFVVTNKVTDNLFVNRLKAIVNIKADVKTLTDIKTNKDNVSITYNENILNVTCNVGTDNTYSFSFTDSNNATVKANLDQEHNNSYILEDSRFPNFVVTPYMIEDKLSFGIKIDWKEWYFTNQTEDGSYYYINQYGNLDKIIKADSAVFTGYESLAGRGYIWSRTIPLLKDYIILGSGADTFALTFPQQDYVNLYNYGFGNQILSKPHSMYLQTGVQTGVLSLVALLVFYGMYFVSSIRLYIKSNFDTYMSQAGVAIFVGTIGYMVSGIANDSTISVAPVFWVLIGLGLAINHNIKASYEK